jgi:DNA-binding CsgD family transcriptional regulator
VDLNISQSELADATLDEEAFRNILSKVARALGARSFIAQWQFNDKTASLLRHSGWWSDDQVESYRQHYAFSDVWEAMTARSWTPNRALDLSHIIPDSEFENSVVYNDFLRAIGDDTYRTLAVPAENEFGVGAIAFQRGKGQPAFSRSELVLLDQYAKPLGTLLALRGQVSGLERQLETGGPIFDVAGAMIVVSDDGSIIHINAPANTLLAAETGVEVRSGRVTTSDSVSAQRLRSAITNACDPRRPTPSTVAIPRVSKLPLMIIVTPVRFSEASWRALLLVRDPGAKPPDLVDRLCATFGLTVAEAQVAVKLAAGDAPSKIAERRGVSAGTVRGQIKTIASKLGCCRQTEIVALLKTMTA